LGTAVLALASLLCACQPEAPLPAHTVIPLPVQLEWVQSDTFHLSDRTAILFDAGDAHGERVATSLAELIGNSVETRPPVRPDSTAERTGAIRLTRAGSGSSISRRSIS
jgi:hypothetical protein